MRPWGRFVEKNTEGKAAEPGETTLTGTLQSGFKVGFGPPGWTLPHQEDGKWRMVEVSMKPIKNPQQFDRKKVTITGELVIRNDPGRGPVPTLMAREVSSEPKGP